MEFVKKTISRNDMFAVLQIRPFSFMMVSEFFSQFAFNMQHFVMIFVIFALTHSNTAVSGIILSFTIPAILFSLITGVFVDRWNKKKVLLSTHLIRGMLLVPFLIPNLHLGLIYTFTFLIAVVTQFFVPAESSIIPQLVPKKLIVPANAVFSFGIFGIMLIGYVLSGPVLLLFGKTYSIIFLMSLFFISALIVARIKITNRKEKTQDENLSSPSNFSVAREAKEIFIFIRRAGKVMRALFMITIAQAVIFMFAVLAPGYVTTILEVPLESLSLILIAPAGLGLGLGALMLGSVGRKFKNKRISAVGFMVVGIVFIFLPFASKVASRDFIHTLNFYLPHIVEITILHIIVALAFIVGFAISLVFIPSNATIQIETHEKMRGRMYGLLSSLVGAVSFLPVILAGGIADLFGVGVVIAGVGVLMAVLSIFLFILE